MKKAIFAFIFLSNLSSLNAQSYLGLGIGFNHAPVYERYFMDKYNLSGSPAIKYQYNWNKENNRSLRVGAEFVYHQGIAISKDSIYDVPPFENNAIGAKTKYVEINRVSARVSVTHEHNFPKFTFYYGGLLQLPIIQRSLILDYTFFNYGQIIGDYDSDYSIKFLHPTSLRFLAPFMGKVGVRRNFSSGQSISLDYNFGVNKRHSMFLCYSFPLGKKS